MQDLRSVVAGIWLRSRAVEAVTAIKAAAMGAEEALADMWW